MLAKDSFPDLYEFPQKLKMQDKGNDNVAERKFCNIDGDYLPTCSMCTQKYPAIPLKVGQKKGNLYNLKLQEVYMNYWFVSIFIKLNLYYERLP